MTRLLIMLCAVLTVVCLSSAGAEEATAITLSCDGTTKGYVKRQESINPVTKMDVVVNIAERRVTFDGRVAHIDQIDARTIFFGGDSVKSTTGYIRQVAYLVDLAYVAIRVSVVKRLFKMSINKAARSD
jgi:hypothetical protein